MTSGIYTITSPSGGQYVGSAVNLTKRRCNHFHLLRAGKHNNHALQRACDKYGLNRLKFTVLRICRKENLIKYEQQAINALKPRYNACLIAGSQLGTRHSEATKIIMSARKLGKIGNRLGQSPTKATRKKISIKLKGRPHPQSFMVQVTIKQRKLLLKLYKSGISYVILAAKYHTSHSIMRRLLIAEGAKIYKGNLHIGKKRPKQVKLKMKIAQQQRRKREQELRPIL